MNYLEKFESPENIHLKAIEKIIENSEKEIQKECLSTGQPWINGYMTQYNVILGRLDLANVMGEITPEEFELFKENFKEIDEIVKGPDGLVEKYQRNNTLMPEGEKEKLMELLNILPRIGQMS